MPSSSTVVRFSQALGFEGFPELSRPRATSVGATRANNARRGPRSQCLFSLDHAEFEAALAADHVNVEDAARKLSRSAVELRSTRSSTAREV